MAAIAVVTQWGAGILLECAVKVAGDPSGGVSIKEIARVASPRLMALPEVSDDLILAGATSTCHI